MYEVITILILLVCVLLGAIVLIQNPKGGGLSSTFGQAGNQLLGFQRSTDIVEKWTWGLLVALLALTLMTSAFIERGTPGVPTGPTGADPTRVQAPPSAAPAPTLELPAPADAPD
jgi:preprotein translocase subunit SecG